MAGQFVGLGEHLVASNPELKVNDALSAFNCLVVLGIGLSAANPTIAPLLDGLSPIKRPTFWEQWVAGWLSLGVGSFVVLLGFNALPLEAVAEAAGWVLLAAIPAFCVDYLFAEKQLDLEAAAQSEALGMRKRKLQALMAAGLASIAGLTVFYLPAVATLLAFATSEDAADYLNYVARTAPFMVLALVSFSPGLVSIGMWCFRRVGLKISDSLGQQAWAYTTTLGLFAFSALTAAVVVSDTWLWLAVIFAALTGVSGWVAGKIYVRLRGNLDTIGMDPDARTF